MDLITTIFIVIMSIMILILIAASFFSYVRKSQNAEGVFSLTLIGMGFLCLLFLFTLIFIAALGDAKNSLEAIAIVCFAFFVVFLFLFLFFLSNDDGYSGAIASQRTRTRIWCLGLITFIFLATSIVIETIGYDMPYDPPKISLKIREMYETE